jgi:PadR family transcriptional regulator PadR
MVSEDVHTNRRAYRKRIGVDMWQSQLRKGSLDLAVLACLWDGPLDRPQICGRLEEMAGIAIINGVLYPILRRLRDARWIETEWVEIEPGHPRQFFCLTGNGRRFAIELSGQWTKFVAGMSRMVGTLAQPDSLSLSR